MTPTPPSVSAAVSYDHAISFVSLWVVSSVEELTWIANSLDDAIRPSMEPHETAALSAMRDCVRAEIKARTFSSREGI